MPDIADGLAGETRAALAEFLLQLADDEIVLGHRDSEWCAFAPVIEEDVAFASIAQDEIAHAAIFYDMLAPLLGRDADALAFARPAAERRNAVLVERPNGDWAYSIVRHYLYDLFDDLRTQLLLGSGIPLLRSVGERVRREEHYHLEHGRTWLGHLAAHAGAARDRVEAAVRAAGAECHCLCQPLAWEQTLVESAVLPAAPSSLWPAYRERMGDVLRPYGLAIPDPPVRGQLAGRVGQHSPELAPLLATMGEVYLSDPEAAW